MQIRELDAAHHEAILGLWERAGLGTARPRGRDDPAAFARQIESGAVTVLGVEQDGRLVAVVLASHDGRKGWINRLAVDPEHRRRRLGRRLLDAAEDALRARGIGVIAALVEEENEASIRLFEEAGYDLARDVLYLSKRDGANA